MDKERVRDAADRIAWHLDEIAKLFTEPVKLTLLVRNPAHPDGSRDVHMSDDETEIAIAAIRTAMATGVWITGPEKPPGG